MRDAKPQPAQAKSAPPAEKARSSSQLPTQTAFNPVWGRLALGIQRAPAPQPTIDQQVAKMGLSDAEKASFKRIAASGSVPTLLALLTGDPQTDTLILGEYFFCSAMLSNPVEPWDRFCRVPGLVVGTPLFEAYQKKVIKPEYVKQIEAFLVTQLQPDPQESTRGMADRFFFELGRSDYRANVPAEAAEQTRLEVWAKDHAGQHVRLVGRSSQEGIEHGALALQRAATVRAVLGKGGVIVDGTQTDSKFSPRPVDYRFDRSVEIIVAGATCSKFTLAQSRQDMRDCEEAFSKAHTRAIAIATAGIGRLRPATDPAEAPAPNRDTVLKDRFPTIALTTLLPRFESVVARLWKVGLKGGHSCNDRCAPDCERPGSASAGGPVELCAPFYVPGFRGGTISEDERVFLILHETTHSAVVPGKPAESIGIDFAYSNTRLFGALEGTEALGNTDSYVMTLLILAGTTKNAPAVIASRGTAPADSLRLKMPMGTSGDRNRTALRAIGFAESWLNYASFWSPALYDFVAASLTTWDANQLGRLGHSLLELFAPLFQLQHPGTAAFAAKKSIEIGVFQSIFASRGFPTPAPSSHALVEDRTRVAGVYDRLTRMHEGLQGPLVIAPAGSGDGSWASAPGLPGLGTEVRLADSFFDLSPDGQVRHIIRLMARAMDVGETWVEAYVEAAEAVRHHRGLGP